MTTAQANRRPVFLDAVLNAAPTPGVLLSDPLVLQALRLPAGTVRALGADVHAWRGLYRAVYTRLQVPPDWLRFWVVMADVDEVPAMHRLHRLLALLVDDPTAQDLTVAEAMSALTEGLLEHQRTAVLLRPGIRQRIINNANWPMSRQTPPSRHPEAESVT